ncbi:hypothetical protein CURE108131_08655 [Cupriavidus respiraculi]|uniref:Translation initiation factor IF-2 n=1 Tax=Cupriavidus respiraculi TaxID=195930 RepID=A0ABM8WM63_9BURK|nr:hypothetical protein [Cupriavidus respiraculi]CAG9168457.1 hypothetical protein LMG21510_01080 [Cupriavidus respiraculi]
MRRQTPWILPLAVAAALAAGTAAAQPAGVRTDDERGSTTGTSPVPKDVKRPGTSAASETRSNPGGLGSAATGGPGPGPGSPDPRGVPSARPATTTPSASDAKAQAPDAPGLKGRERSPARTGGASIDQTREPNTKAD